ncbi:Neuralized-like protein 4 [Homalodisca vitripennis]|nr:Neuralized-like protein 4 [Homalodisca vitripennis]KAG8289239.1 Neuralized-like protein 4 [Homalodisca vitripennis]
MDLLSSGDEVFHNNKLVRSHYCRSLSLLRVGARVGIKRCNDGTLHVFINGHDQGIAAHNIPKWCCYGILDVYGGTVAVRVTSKVSNNIKGEVTLADPEEELSSACPPTKRY